MANKKLSTRYYSSQQEKSVAKAIGGKTTPNSGARPFAKGDVVKASNFSSENFAEQESWMLEMKTCMTNKMSFAIKKQWLETLKEEAFQAGKTNYALCFSFGPKQPNYYILSEDKFQQLFGGN